jgi:hypothetical protein
MWHEHIEIKYASSEGEKCVGVKMWHLQDSQSEFPFWELGVSWSPKCYNFFELYKRSQCDGVGLSKQISWQKVMAIWRFLILI